MTSLALELSQLEVETIEVQEAGITILHREQNKNLETLVAPGSKNDVLAILTLTTFLPVNGCGGSCGSCACGDSCPCTCSCLCALKCGCGCSCDGPNCSGSCSCSCNCVSR